MSYFLPVPLSNAARSLFVISNPSFRFSRKSDKRITSALVLIIVLTFNSQLEILLEIFSEFTFCAAMLKGGQSPLASPVIFFDTCINNSYRWGGRR
jgi:hypothetical protein